MISSLQSPYSIVTTAATVMDMEGCLIVSTCIILLRSGSEVDAEAASASVEMFSPLGIRHQIGLRGVYRYERRLRKANVALVELASVKKGTESLQAELM